MEDLRFVSDVVEEFFGHSRIKKSLQLIREKQITGWEKWLQVEFGIFLDEHDMVMQPSREGLFEVDRRKDQQKSKIYVDLIFRKKNCTKDFFLGLELKQADSVTTCLNRMIDDANKIWKVKGNTLRQCFMVGIHAEANNEEIVERVWERCNTFLPSKQRIISKNIGRTGYSYTIF